MLSSLFLTSNMVDNGNSINPSWCNYVPFSDFFSACAPETQQQQQARIRAELSTTQLTPTQIDTTLQAAQTTIQNDMVSNPNAYLQYNAATEYPLTSAVVGPTIVGNVLGTTGANGEPSTMGSSYTTIAILIVLGVIVANKLF